MIAIECISALLGLILWLSLHLHTFHLSLEMFVFMEMLLADNIFVS